METVTFIRLKKQVYSCYKRHSYILQFKSLNCCATATSHCIYRAIKAENHWYYSNKHSVAKDIFNKRKRTFCFASAEEVNFAVARWCGVPLAAVHCLPRLARAHPSLKVRYARGREHPDNSLLLRTTMRMLAMLDHACDGCRVLRC
jgi:hypothetical protein